MEAGAAMKLITEKGEFDSFAELRYAFIKQNKAAIPVSTDEWESTTLHASEVGYCPRATMLRICGAPPKVQANLTQANEALLFAIAYFAHYLTYEAMKWAGILVASEEPLLDGLWSGRCDAIFLPDCAHPEQEMLYDAKTTRPNAFKYADSFPKEQHCLQLGAYGTSRRCTDILFAVIEYIDRGGSNPPVECHINLLEWTPKAQAKMDEREAMYHECAGKDWQDAPLPPVLAESYVPHYRKARGMEYKDLKSVTWECSWECSWCKLHHTHIDGSTRPDSPCKPPNHAPVEVAKMRTQKEGSGWGVSAGAGMDVRGIQQVIATFTPRVPVVGGDEE